MCFPSSEIHRAIEDGRIPNDPSGRNPFCSTRTEQKLVTDEGRIVGSVPLDTDRTEALTELHERLHADGRRYYEQWVPRGERTEIMPIRDAEDNPVGMIPYDFHDADIPEGITLSVYVEKTTTEIPYEPKPSSEWPESPKYWTLPRPPVNGYRTWRRPAMTKYRKRPVEIDAVQNLGDHEFVMEWISKLPKKRVEGFVQSRDLQLMDDGTIHVRTHHGMATVEVGDYLLYGVDGEFYPCRADVFRETYERVPVVEAADG